MLGLYWNQGIVLTRPFHPSHATLEYGVDEIYMDGGVDEWVWVLNGKVWNHLPVFETQMWG